ncbi:hypothetical protein GTP41_06195 [Pseudoduganella sp. DS3]|uniref:Serine dehydrogenase proteinase n=1 Tax=Pseudoduganella guangdongensis TaxID=2692179 RepID=A0A6N9HEL8_9BURK|nr:hypothetical protein [Pseudoduganella guangdongensis]MYN01687.1 hypothetical protein [Pseudoduganella guangdongensis]
MTGFAGLQALRGLEQVRSSRVLVLAATTLDIDMLPALYDQLRAIGKNERLDVLLFSRGGVVNGARRIALLLREFTQHLGVIVPHYCESSATLLAMAADEIIAGDLAIFSPIDPHLHGDAGGDTSSISAQDIRLFGKMCASWFGADPDAAREQALALMCQNIFPPTLAAFYRTTLEMEQIGEELLRRQLPRLDTDARRAIVRRLMQDYHSHNYALTGQELGGLGLRVERHAQAEALAWDIARALHTSFGRGAAESEEDEWDDMLLATRDSLHLRRRRPGGLHGRWRAIKPAAQLEAHPAP